MRESDEIQDSAGYKLWIYRCLIVNDEQTTLMASSLLPKIYRCDLTFLFLSNQSLTFHDFQKFISSGSLKILFLSETIVKIDDGTIVPIEKLIEHLPKLQDFQLINVSGDEGLHLRNRC